MDGEGDSEERGTWYAGHRFLVLAALIWLAPAIIALATRYWTTEQGAQGPIILATGIWAVVHQFRQRIDLAIPGRVGIAVAIVGLSVAVYVLARMTGSVSVELLAGYAAILAILYAYVGAALLRRTWMPLVYLLWVVPMPFIVEQAVTRNLKLSIARWSVDLLSMFGFDVANSGNALFIDQYQLRVDAACSGLNSIFSLTAIGLFYIFWARTGGRQRAVLLSAAIIPLAILTNLARVALTLLLVRWFGDRVLASVLHPGLGFLMFVVALALLVGLDAAIGTRTGRRVARTFRMQPA